MSNLTQNEQNLIPLEKLEKLQADYPISQSYSEEIASYLNENVGLIDEEKGLEIALLKVLEKRCSEVDSLPTSLPTGGAIPMYRRDNPTTLREAGEQAVAYLKRKSF